MNQSHPYSVISAPNPYLKSKQAKGVIQANQYEVTWPQLCELYKNGMTLIENKDDASLIYFNSWKPDFEPAKNKQGKTILVDGKTLIAKDAPNVDMRTVLVLDYDGALIKDKIKEELKGFNYIAHTTFGHSVEKTKVRVLIEMAEPVSNDEFIARTDALLIKFSGVDPASFYSAQGFYPPSCSDENKDFSDVWVNNGQTIDILSLPQNEPKTETNGTTEQAKPSDNRISLAGKSDARDYLVNFIGEYLPWKGHHQEAIRLHSILESFGFPKNEHIHTMKLFVAPSSKHDIERGFQEANPIFGGMGNLVNLLKDFNVLADFSLNKFNRLSGNFSLNTLKGQLNIKNPRSTQPVQLKDDEKLSHVLNDFDFPYGISLLKSPTNTGKTYLIFNKLTGKRLIIEPTIALVEQQFANAPRGAEKCYGQMKFPVKADVVIMTYEKLAIFASLVRSGKIKAQDYDLYIDEAHSLFTAFGYRAKTMNQVYDIIHGNYLRKIVLMSGTIRNEFLPELQLQKEIVVTREKEKKQPCVIVKTDNWKQLAIDKIDTDFCTIILLNDKSKADAFGNYLNDKLNIKTQVFHADNQQEKDNQQMLVEECMLEGVKVLIFTNLGVEGLNLNNNDIRQVIAIEHQNSIVLEQLVNRARKTTPSLCVTRTLNAKDSGFIQQVDINGVLEDSKRFINFANNVIVKLEGDERTASVNQLLTSVKSLPSNLRDSIRYNYMSEQFEVSHLGLAYAVFSQDDENERYNAELFDKHMSAYYFEITRETKIYKDDTVSKAIDKAAKESKDALKAEQTIKYVEIMEKYATDVSSLRHLSDCLQNNGYDEYSFSGRPTKLPHYEEVQPYEDLIIKSAILSHFYSYKDLMEIMLSHIKKGKVFDKAKDYGKQINDDCLFRRNLQALFQLDVEYSIEEVAARFEELEKRVSRHFAGNLDKARSKNGRTRVLNKFFNMKIDDRRVNGNKNKSRFFKVVSYNPVGKEVIKTKAGY